VSNNIKSYQKGPCTSRAFSLTNQLIYDIKKGNVFGHHNQLNQRMNDILIASVPLPKTAVSAASVWKMYENGTLKIFHNYGNHFVFKEYLEYLEGLKPGPKQGYIGVTTPANLGLRDGFIEKEQFRRRVEQAGFKLPPERTLLEVISVLRRAVIVDEWMFPIDRGFHERILSMVSFKFDHRHILEASFRFMATEQGWKPNSHVMVVK
jgi:hypothetical protein